MSDRIDAIIDELTKKHPYIDIEDPDDPEYRDDWRELIEDVLAAIAAVSQHGTDPHST